MSTIPIAKVPYDNARPNTCIVLVFHAVMALLKPVIETFKTVAVFEPI